MCGKFVRTVVGLAGWGWLGLIGSGSSLAAEPPATLTLATTTSTQDSGLLDVLLPLFEKQTQIKVKVIAVGSGQALELGRRGDADVLLAHSPEAEQKFMAEGGGAERRSVMYNDFVLVGPARDPAKVRSQKTIVAALQELARIQATFVSRGDESGTHQKERALWKQAAVEPAGAWYISAGSGMGAVLRMANEKQAYTLTDRGTYLAQRRQLDLALLHAGDAALRNPYSVITVSSAKHPHVQRAAAQRFAQFLVSPAAQKAIGEFGVAKFGQPLFFPSARDGKSGPARE